MKSSNLSKHVLLYLVASCTLFLFNCGKGSKTTEESQLDPSSLAEATADTPSELINVKLSGVYVTSIKTPHSSFDARNLFDENENTYWATMPGAGPDEGIMLYFQDPQYISHIELKQFAGSYFSKITRVTIYVNGQDLFFTNGRRFFSSLDDKIKIDQQEVSSLYIRIARLEDMVSILKEDYPYGSVNYSSFDVAKSAAISELVLYADENKLRLISPRKVEGTISTSSTLSPKQSYGVQNLFDSRKEFAWVEGADGNGINESISIELKEKIELTALKVFNGYQRSEKHYKANARLKSMTVTNEYSQTASIVFQDIQGEQTAFLSSPLEGNSFKLTVREVFAGSSYKDLVISELKLVSHNSDIVVEENLTEDIKIELFKKIEGTVLKQYVDRRISNEPGEPGEFDRSIILRSDYTFVAYDYEDYGDSSEELIADGNWEIKKLNKEQARIRVFGKLIRNSETIDYYAGDTHTQKQQIFQDFLTITSDMVKGEKFIPAILKVVADDK